MEAALPALRGLPAGPGRVGRLGAGVAGLAGWRRRGLAFGLGALAALALPPVHLLPVLLLAFPGLVWLCDGADSRRAAFGAGFWFGSGWFVVGLYWISHALLTDPARFGWMIPFAVFGLSGLLAAFVGLATLLVHLLKLRGPAAIPALAAAWTVSEWLRSWVLTGFPWNPLGSVWDVSAAMLQLGALAGVFGLSLLTALAAMLPAVLAYPLAPRVKAAALAVACLLPLAAFAGGAARLAAAPPAGAEAVPGLRLRLVQAAIDQAHKWREELRQRNLETHVELSRSPGFDAVTHVVWPETAAAFFLDLDAPRRALAARAAPPGGLLLTGAPRITPEGVEPFQVWNSLMAVDDQARMAGIYDKVHLVPFGEYVPLRKLLPIAKVTHGATDFSPGPGLRTLDLPGLPPFSTLICYEAIFPGAVVGAGQPRPAWLLTITNDGWFGMSAGPYQHLAAARMRAIEEGLPMVRAANTGISAVFDAYGREMGRLPLGVRGVLDADLPKPVPGSTIFGSYGNLLPLAAAALLLMVSLRLRKFSG